MKSENSVAGLRTRLLLCLVALLAAIGASRAEFSPDTALRTEAASAGQTKLIADGTKSRSAYIWSAMLSDSSLHLRGVVPSEEDHRTLLGMVKAHFPDLEVEDKLKIVAGGPPKEQWLGAVSFGLKQLSHLKSGSVRIVNVGLAITGEARSADDYTDVKKALAGPLPTGLDIRGDEVRPPIADPFVFTADLGANALSLSGSVPSEDLRKQLRDMSRQLFERPGLDDRLQLASGAPKDWDEAVTAALRALSRLESGKVALSGLAVSIEGVAPDKGTAVAVSYQLRRDLPKLFSTSENIKWKEASSASQGVASQVLPRIKKFARTDNKWPEGELPPLAPLVEEQ
jgi:hypothetical protein